MDIIKGKIQKPQKVVIYGPEGIGKSTFASQFPSPIFIDTEGSTSHLEVDRIPRPSSWPLLLADIFELKKDHMGYQTLVIDTVDWAELVCIDSICKKNGMQSIESFGYGKGYVYVKEEFGRLLNALEDLTESGMNVVLTAHCLIRKFERPAEPPFDRYELKLSNKAGSSVVAMVKEWSDMLLFANYEYNIYEAEKNGRKKASGGKRVMFATHHPDWDAKNRHGLPDKMPFDYQQIAHCIPGDPTYQGTAISKPATPVQPETPVAAPKPEPKEQPKQETKQESKSKQETAALDLNIPKALRDLMQAADVSELDIRSAVAAKGYFPLDCPITQYPPDFVDGCLVQAWNQMLDFIKQRKENVPF